MAAAGAVLRIARSSMTASTKAPSLLSRGYATAASNRAHHRVVVVGAGTAGVTVAAQLKRTPQLASADIAILDPASTHHYQPGWTLVGSGLRDLGAMQRPLPTVLPDGVRHYPLSVSTFDPENNAVRTNEGVNLSYDYLVVAPGLQTNFAGVSGLEAALANSKSMVSSIYSDRTVEQVWKNIQGFKKGRAIFTQPAGIIKCAGAPQKILWMALSQWKRDGVRANIDATFATGGAGTCHCFFTTTTLFITYFLCFPSFFPLVIDLAD